MVRPLRAKSLAVLDYLARHRDRLVPQRELLRAVWPGLSVSPTVLRVCIREIRAALGNDAASRIVTLAGRGYRFLSDPDADGAGGSTFVGRHGEIARLHEALAQARSGHRQVVFVVGEAGVGKTALLGRFLDEVRAAGRTRGGLGQCLELHSGLEPYAPVLDLLNRLCDEDDRVLPTLQRWAPSWVQHMPGRAAAADPEPHRITTPSAERMLRELSEAIEQLAGTAPVMFMLKDIHWSDASTLEAIAHLAQRTTTAQLLIIASYRPSDVEMPSNHVTSLRRRLRARALCSDVHLKHLHRQDIEAYLQRRLRAPALSRNVVDTIARYSGGHPLFMVSMVDHLLTLGRLTNGDGTWRIEGSLDGVIPNAIGELVASRIERLDRDTRRVVEGASVVGTSFSAAAVAAAIGLSIEIVEAVCTRLTDIGKLISTGVEVWPDGTVSARYEFAHGLYADVLYQQLAPADRTRMHRAVAEAISTGQNGSGKSVAAVVARHFTLGADPRRALHFHIEAARGAKLRFAAREATAHLHTALELLQALPETRERMGTELGCLLELAATSATINDFAALEVGETYVRAGARARLLGLVPAQIVAVAGQYAHHIVRAELAMAQSNAEQLIDLAASMPAPFFNFLGDACLGAVLFSRGTLAPARVLLERSDAAWDAGFPPLARDAAIICRGMLALTLLVLGQDRCAAAALQRALDRTADLSGHPFDVAEAHTLAAQFHATRGTRAAAREHADQALAVANEHGIASHRATATVVRGWALGDVDAVRKGLTLRNEIGHRLARTLLDGLLAETLLDNGDVHAALDTIDGALAFAAETGEATQLAELHRLRGECLLRRAGVTRLSKIQGRAAREAANAFHSAVTIAKQQQALLWQRRAERSLSN